MKKRNYVLATSLAAAAAAALLIIGAGCEATSPDEMSVTVEPDYAKLRAGESVTMTASGWISYRWSLSDPDIGYLSSTVGERVTYRRTQGPEVTSSAIVEGIASVENGGVVTMPVNTSTNTFKFTTRITTRYEDHGDVWKKIVTTEYTAQNHEHKLKDNIVTEFIKKDTINSAQLKQIITVSAVGSQGTTNSSAVASGKVTILQVN